MEAQNNKEQELENELENELSVMGVSRLMRRNIVIGGYAALMAAIIALTVIIGQKDREIIGLNEKVNVCERRFAEEIRELKNDQIRYMLAVQDRIREIEEKAIKRKK